MQAIVVNRLSKGIIETKEEATPEEKVLEAVNVNRSRTVKIYAPLSDKNTVEGKNAKVGKFLARGIVYSEDGLIITNRSYFQEGVSYSVFIPGQKDFITIEPLTVGDNFVTFKVDVSVPLVAQISKAEVSKGDMVVAIGGHLEDTMATGEVFLVDKSTDTTFIITTIPAKSVEIGAPLMNIDGKIIGLHVKGSVDGKAVFISMKNTGKIIKK
jgi:S1-C subfamily serine protease